MSVESSIRYGNEGGHSRIFNHGGNAQHYGTVGPFNDGTRHVDWRLAQLWEQENPNPNITGRGYTEDEHEDFMAWNEIHRQVQRVCWMKFHFPQFHLLDWIQSGWDEDLERLSRLTSRHICGVCGRADDDGCTEGC